MRPDFQCSTRRLTAKWLWLALLVHLTSGCGWLFNTGTKFKTSSDEAAEVSNDEQNVEVPVTVTGDGKAAGLIKSDATGVQVLRGTGSTATSGTAVTFPPGSLSIATTVTIGAGENLTTGDLTQLGVSGPIVAAGAATEILSSVSTNAIVPFAISLPLPDRAKLGLMNLETRNIAVIYRIKIAGESTERAGIVGPDSLRFIEAENRVEYDSLNFGVFQVIITSDKIVASKQADPAKVFNGAAADTTPPTPGSIAADSITLTGYRVYWTAGVDSVTPVAQLSYFLCFAATALQIDSVAKCEAAGPFGWQQTLERSVSGLNPQESRFYSVIVKDAAGNKALYIAQNIATGADIANPTPGVLSFSSGTLTSLSLGWTAASDNHTAAGLLQYRLCRGATITDVDTVAKCDSATTVVDYTANSLTATQSGLVSGTSYAYAVVVRDQAGNKGLYAPLATSVPTDAPVTSEVTPDAGPERRSFRDKINNTHWVFSRFGNGIRFSRSADGAVWFNAGTIPVDSGDFALTYDVISGTPYVFLVAAVNFDVVMYRGTISASGITFEAAVTVFDGSSRSAKFIKPTITTTDSFVWVAAAQYSVPMWNTVVKKSVEAPNANLSTWSLVAAPATATSAGRDSVLLGRPANQVALVEQDVSTVRVYEFNGSTWTETTTNGVIAATTLVADAGLVTAAPIFAMAVCEGRVYVGGANIGGPGGAPQVYGTAYWDGGQWRAMGGAYFIDVKVIKCGPDGVYYGGSFTNINGITSANKVVRWDGNTWRDLGTATLNGDIYDIEVVGSNVYVVGSFTAPYDHIMKWDGSTWSSVNSVTFNNNVLNIASYGSNLYVGGGFTMLNGSGCNYMARFDGASWTCMSDGTIANSVQLVDVSPTGTVYVAGAWANSLSSWNGAAWVALSGQPSGGTPAALLFDGSDIYVGGSFTTGITRYNGTTWTAIGTTPNVNAIVKYEGDVIAGGSFTNMSSNPGSKIISRYDGTNWIPFAGAGTGTVNVTRIVNGKLFVAGSFSKFAGLTNGENIVFWDGASWQAMGTGVNGAVLALESIGNTLYVGGSFTTANGQSYARVAKWDSTTNTWSAAPTGLPTSGTVKSLKAVGTAIYLGGNSSTASERVMYSDGTNPWISKGAPDGDVNTVEHDGTNLYAGGIFTNVGATPANRVAKYNGTVWSAMSSGLSSTVNVLHWNGTTLFAGGQFSQEVAFWSGSSWSGTGTVSGAVNGLATFEGVLYVSGQMANGFKKWDGATTWSTMTKPMGYTGGSMFVNAEGLYVASGPTVLRLSKSAAGDMIRSFDAVLNDANDLRLVYNTAGSIGTRLISSGNIGSETTLQSWANAVVPAGPSVTASVAMNKQWATWTVNGAVQIRNFDGSTWLAATELIPAASGVRKSGCDLKADGGQFKCTGLKSNLPPYKVNVSLVTP